MNNLKFEVISAVGQITANFDEVERDVESRMSLYDGVMFTEEEKADAKKQVASLRKDKKDILDSFKQVKDIWMEPLNQFKKRVDQLAEKVDKPINHINGQVEAFEAKRLDERKEEMQAIYDDEIGDLREFLPLYKIRDEKWLNAGKSLKAIRKEMAETISSVRAGKLALESMTSDIVPSAIKKFQASLNLPEALAYISTYEAQRADVLRREEEHRQQEEERRHLAEINRIRAEERNRIAEEERIRKDAVESIKKVDETASESLKAPQARTVVYTVLANDAELAELEMALDSLGIYYERKDI